MGGEGVGGNFLDVVAKLPYLVKLGINAVQLLPVVEYPTQYSLGYNGVDYFSPETDYGVPDTAPNFDDYCTTANNLLLDRQANAVLFSKQQLTTTVNQLRVLIDLCHVYGVAVILDVVYNHAGGDFGDKSLYFLDRQPTGDQNRSLYFTDHGWAGGLVFAYWNADVRQFLIDNALMWLQECHADGFRYDEVSVMFNEGGEWGYTVCQHLTDTCRYVRPDAVHIGEHWPPQKNIVTPTSAGGAGFDACLNDGLREAVRGAISQASYGAHIKVNMDAIAAHLSSTQLGDRRRAVQMVENHDIVREGRAQRLALLADSNNPESWYARSRARVALGLVVTAPGIPHIFMGQECLESAQWSDVTERAPAVNWQALNQNNERKAFLQFSQTLLALRAREPALSSETINVFHVHNDNRVLAFHRWLPGVGRDVVVIVSLNEQSFSEYTIGVPFGGTWYYYLNSDDFEFPATLPMINVQTQANSIPMHGLNCSLTIQLPANSIVVLGAH